MGFMDFLGEMVGTLAAQGNEIQGYKKDYEFMSDQQLLREYNNLKGKSGQENKNRFYAIKSVLSDRGYGNS